MRLNLPSGALAKEADRLRRPTIDSQEHKISMYLRVLVVRLVKVQAVRYICQFSRDDRPSAASLESTRREGKQIVVESKDYPLKYYIFEEQQQEKIG